MTKITIENIREHLISKGWEEDEFFEGTVYISPNGRYELNYNEGSNLCDEDGFGWVMHIDDSRHVSLACCDVEYIEQIDALIDIYKDY